MTAVRESSALSDYALPRESEWQALHIFYTASARPLIAECIEPLIRSLRDDELIRGYFFINYWLGGPHVRLRVLPTDATSTPEARRRVEEHVAAFLAVRPALFEVTNDNLVDYYEKLFEIEYPGANRAPYEDDHGRMRMRDNNSFSWEPYDPEYDRYGGPVGIQLSEVHFEVSSDLVVMMDRQMNVHLRTVRLGVSLQLMLVIAVVFLGGDAEKIAEFFAEYGDNWRRDFTGTDFVTDRGYERDYAAITAKARARFDEVRDSIENEHGSTLSGFLRGWAEHCLELRAEISRLADEGLITFPPEPGAVAVPVSASSALRRLLGSYIHMTNNRLSTTIGDEAYLSHILAGALGAVSPAEASTEPS